MSRQQQRVQSSDVPPGMKTRGHTGWDNIGLALAIGWIITPAIQYFGTVQRTELMLQGDAAYPSMARLDLITVYYLLLALTVLFVIIRIYTHPTNDDAGEILH